jgi:hypothetical protein
VRSKWYASITAFFVASVTWRPSWPQAVPQISVRVKSERALPGVSCGSGRRGQSPANVVPAASDNMTKPMAARINREPRDGLWARSPLSWVLGAAPV